MLGVARFHGLVVDRGAGVEHRRRHPDLAGELADHRHVLLPDCDLHGGVVVAVLDHHGRAQLEHARIAGAGGDHLEDLLRVEPRLDAEHHGLRRRDVVDGDQEVRDIFHAAAVAEYAEVVRGAGETGEQRLELADRLAVAAGVDHEILGPGLRAGAADRTIEHHMAGLAQHAFGLDLVVDRERARFDDHARTHAGGDDLLRRLLERGGLGQTGDDGRHRGGERRHVGRDLHAGARQGAAASRVDVVAHDVPAGLDEVLRERAAHDAETDDTDFPLGHSALRCVIDSSRTLYVGRAAVQAGPAVFLGRE